MCFIPEKMITKGFTIVILVTGFISSAIGASEDWSYDGKHGPGPANWSTITKFERCEHLGQSPINIVTRDVVYDSSLTPITMDDYYQSPHNFTMHYENNKHTAVVNLDGDYLIHGGGLPYTYKAAQFHFHWGNDNTKGSEHTVDGKSYPMEVHIVHYNTIWTSVAAAADKKFGLAVIGFFFEIVNKTNPNWHWLIDYNGNITNGDDKVELPVFRLDTLLAHDYEHYYRYEGSLTTPPCYESATWTVFHETIKISQAQLDSFRELYYTKKDDPNPQHMTNNFRPTQPLNHRTVYTSTAPAATRPQGPIGSATINSMSIILMGAIILFAKFYTDSK